MMAFAAAPGKEQKHLRKAARSQRQAGAEAVPQISKINIARCQRHFPLVRRKSESHRPPDGVLKTFSKQQQVRRAEAIILKAAKRGIAVNVRSAERWLEIKRHEAPGIGG